MSHPSLLDTNVVSHIMQGRDADLLACLSQLPFAVQHAGSSGHQPERLRHEIAAHAVAVNATLVSRDTALVQVNGPVGRAS